MQDRSPGTFPRRRMSDIPAFCNFSVCGFVVSADNVDVVHHSISNKLECASIRVKRLGRIW